MSIDLRQNMEKFLKDYGHPVILLRTNQKIRCTCWNELYKQPNKSHDICLGTGYLFGTEKHLVSSTIKTSPDQLNRSTDVQIVGDIEKRTKIFYMKFNTLPRQGDIIVECAWNGNTPIIDDYTNAFVINYPQPMYGDKGRVEYFRVGCQADPINKHIRLVDIARRQYIAIDEG